MIADARRANARFDAQAHFVGQGKQVAPIAPSLLAHLATELKDEAVVNKGRRKACEFAALREKR